MATRTLNLARQPTGTPEFKTWTGNGAWPLFVPTITIRRSHPLERQLRRTPGDLVLRETLGVCYFMADKFTQAAAVFTPALDKLSSNPGVLYAAGVSLARSRNDQAASQLFSRLLKDNPNIPQVHLLLGEAHADLAEYQEALAEFSRALELNPRLAEAHYYKGIVRFKQGQMDDAAQEFQDELVQNPNSAAALYQLAVVRLGQHQLDESISLLNQVLAQSPANADARYQLGKAMLEKAVAGIIGCYSSWSEPKAIALRSARV